MNIAICDYNYDERKELMDALNNYFINTSVISDFALYDNETDLYFDISNGVKYDIVFLEINLPVEPKGINFAKRLRNNNYKGKIFFNTSSNSYAAESYEVCASGYIVKPISNLKIRKCMDRYINEFETEYYTIKQKKNDVYIPINDIMYFESENTKCYINCCDGKQYTIYKQLRQIEKELNNSRFLRCHQSFIVNMNYIAEVDDVFILKNGAEVLIRQREKSLIKKRYYSYTIDKSI